MNKFEREPQMDSILPKDNKKRTNWALLRENPDQLALLIETEAKGFIGVHGKLTYKTLYVHGRGDLCGAIGKDYPGAMRGLKQKLDIQESSRPPGSWTPDIILEQARGFVNDKGFLSQKLLSKNKRQDLLHAINRYYPGGLTRLKKKLGISERQPIEVFWTKERIEKEASDLALANDNYFPGGGALIRMGKGPLASAIDKKYQGGIRQLRLNLGFQKPRPQGMWNEEKIEEEMRKLLKEEELSTIPSTNQLLLMGKSRLVGAIATHYPGKITGLRRRFGEEPKAKKPDGFWKNLDNIENEAIKFISENNDLNGRLLSEKRKSSLGVAITKYYPGGMIGLKNKLGLPTVESKNNLSQSEIESQALIFYESHGRLSEDFLRRNGNRSLANAIRNRYPGGIRQLKAHLNIENVILERSIKSNSTSPNYWTIEKIEEEARKFLNEHGYISNNLLKKIKGSGGLFNAIYKKYPGKLTGLKQKLGLSVSPQKPDGYWKNLELIETEAIDFYRSEGELNATVLDKKGRSDLRGAIFAHYPGGIRELKKKIGIKVGKEKGYWDIEKIEEESSRFYQEFGRLSPKILDENGRGGLRAAIQNYYPEAWIGLKKKLGIEYNMPPGYWTTEKIEEIALTLYKEQGELNYVIIQNLRKHGLSSAISSKYPGGIKALREKLGIADSRNSINQESAREDLWSLLEPQKYPAT